MLLALSLSLLLRAETKAPDSARIEYEQAEAQKAVDAKYGNKKASELTHDETVAKIRDQAEAEAKVLSKYGISVKEWARESLSKNRAALADQKAGVKAVAKGEAEAAEAAKKASHEVPQEIIVQRDISESNPVILEEKKVTGPPMVEQGLPPEAQEDELIAREVDGAMGGKKIEGSAAPRQGHTAKTKATKTTKTEKKSKKKKKKSND